MEAADQQCIDCGRTLVNKSRGRPALRCGECKRGRRRVKVRADVQCAECGTLFKPPGHTGVPPKRCPPCAAIAVREQDRQKQARWRAANPDKARAVAQRHNEKRQADPAKRALARARERMRVHGVSEPDYERMLESQGGVCAICMRPPRGRANGRAREGLDPTLHVDHCHASGRIRGLLCSNCNTMLGLAADDPAILERAIAYLKEN